LIHSEDGIVYRNSPKETSITNHFCIDSQDNECLTTLLLSFQKNFVADFLQEKCNFRGKMAILRLWAPLGGLRGNARWSS